MGETPVITRRAWRDRVTDMVITGPVDAEQLYATPIPVTLRASQPVAPPAESGFNLSFRDVLPAGVSYLAGSSTPAPQVINDQPSLGMTTLIWSNVADLAPGSDFELTYEVEYDETQDLAADRTVRLTRTA